VFVSFEGLDGSGKSTQAALLHEHLVAAGRDAVLTREPGGTPLGEELRELVLRPGLEMTPWSEAALFTAARAELAERVIRPALDRGADVVSDRYLDSSLAYQGIARGLGMDRILELNLQATGALLPDRTFLVLVEPEEAARRQQSTGARDRIEDEGVEFLRTVDSGYRELAALFPRRIVQVDASSRPEDVAKLILGQLRDLL
jgi:dTMP kinase